MPALGERPKQLVGFSQGGMPVGAVGLAEAAEPQVFLDRQLGEHPASLRHVADPKPGDRLGCEPRDLFLVEPDRAGARPHRSEEHTSELQSHVNLVCRLLLEKKKKELKRSKLMNTNTHLNLP